MALTFLYLELGIAILAGIAVMLLVVPVNVIGGNLAKKWQVDQLKAKDTRIKLMNEIIAGMKVLKLYAWEIPFRDRINKIRKTEIKVIKKMGNYFGVLTSSFTITPILVVLVVFAVYVAVDPDNHILTPDKVFVCLSLMNLIRLPLIMFPWSLMECVKLVISINRIGKFLNAEELHFDPFSEESIQDAGNSIEMVKANCEWSSDEPHAALTDVTLNVEKGALVGVVGSVGAGKSSLLSAMLGEMERVSGSIAMQGKVAYVPQQPWIQNMELKSNILFENPLLSRKYDEVVDACALSDDLAILTSGVREARNAKK